AQAHHRQPRLLQLVDARLAGAGGQRAAVRGTGRALVRRGLGPAPRRGRVRALARQGAGAVARRDGGLGQPGDHRILRRPDRARPLLAGRRCGPRHGPVDGGGNALGLRQPAPRPADERAQDPRRAPVVGGGHGRDQPHPDPVGAGPRALRRHRRLSVRAVVRGRHDVRARGHPVRHLRRSRAALRRRLYGSGSPPPARRQLDRAGAGRTLGHRPLRGRARQGL
ncbi:MAG: Glutathione S-transferase, partial [uncultured Sphingomonas sp.]